MEVISSNDGLLTNIEVLEILKENKMKRSNTGAVRVDLQNRELVESKAIKYVSNTIVGHLTSTVVGECLSKIKKLDFGLTEGELTQIANLAPESEVEFYLIIEECSQRCNDEQLEQIKEIITSTYAQYKK